MFVTGSHLASLRALRARQADVAAIDAVTWHILERIAPNELMGIPLVGKTGEALAPPYVTRKGHDRFDLLAKLQRGITADASSEARQLLGLVDIQPARKEDYEPVLEEYRSLEFKHASFNRAGVSLEAPALEKV